MTNLRIEHFSDELRKMYTEEELLNCDEDGVPLLCYEPNTQVCAIHHIGDYDPDDNPLLVPVSCTYISKREAEERNARIEKAKQAPEPLYNKDGTKHIMISFRTKCSLISIGVENLDDLLDLPMSTVLQYHRNIRISGLNKNALLELISVLNNSGYREKSKEFMSIKDEFMRPVITTNADIT